MRRVVLGWGRGGALLATAPVVWPSRQKGPREGVCTPQHTTPHTCATALVTLSPGFAYGHLGGKMVAVSGHMGRGMAAQQILEELASRKELGNKVRGGLEGLWTWSRPGYDIWRRSLLGRGQGSAPGAGVAESLCLRANNRCHDLFWTMDEGADKEARARVLLAGPALDHRGRARGRLGPGVHVVGQEAAHQHRVHGEPRGWGLVGWGAAQRVRREESEYRLHTTDYSRRTTDYCKV